MSLRDVRDDSRASPLRARSLFTVRAAISFARLVDSPRSSALSLMCSYWRSRFLLDPAGMPTPCGALSVVGPALDDRPALSIPPPMTHVREAGELRGRVRDHAGQ